MHCPVLIIILIFSVIFASCAKTTDKMPFKISTEEVFDPVLHFDRDLNSTHFKEHPINETNAEEILALLYDSAEIEKVKRGPLNEYISLDINGGGLITIRSAKDGEHIFFRRDNESLYKAKNPELAAFIAQQVQSLTDNGSNEISFTEEYQLSEKSDNNSDAVSIAEEFFIQNTFIQNTAELESDLQAWQTAKRMASSFAASDTTIELSQIGAHMNSNGTYLSETTETETGIKRDSFRTTRDEYNTLNWEFLTVEYIPIDPGMDDSEVFRYAESFLKPIGTVAYQQCKQLDPDSFYGNDTPILNMQCNYYMSEISLSSQVDFVHDVYTRYLLHYADDNGEYVLSFDFYCAHDYGDDFIDPNFIGWRLIQTLDDCEQWMKTLTFKN